jgi:ABC-type multidrug transport system ATPase subunit
MNNIKLNVENVTKQYRAGKVVFSDITMEFSPGDAVLLKGPNGSGKTTFLKLISVNTFPTKGIIRYGDLIIHDKPYRYLKNVGLVHDEEDLPQHMSATELLEWVLRTREMWDESSNDKIGSILDHLELDDSRFDEIGTYSTGMRKKAQIAAAFIINPSILVLDEPLRGLDQTSTVKVKDLIKQAVERNTILLMASHAEAEKDGIFQKVLNFPLKSS